MTTAIPGARDYDVRITYFTGYEAFAEEVFTVTVGASDEIHAIARAFALGSAYSNPLIPDLACLIAIEPIEPDDPERPPPTTALMMPKCRHCGSTAISRDACVQWDVPSQSWDLVATYDSTSCENCGAESNHLADWVPALPEA